MMQFANKKIIITGANRSIGQAMAIAFAKEGADIVISYRQSKQGADETVRLITAACGKATAVQCDFTNMENVQTFAKQAINILGGIDVLINNAGALSRERMLQITPEKMQYVFQVNTLAPLYLAQLCAESMIDNQRPGNIINITSIAAMTTLPKGILYASSKAAINKWTQNAALDLAEHNIRVNAIAPGVIEAGMNENTATENPELWETYLNKIPLKKCGTPEDVTNMALFLASDKAKWITGKIYAVDGGHVL